MSPEQAATIMGILTPAFAFQPDTIAQWADMILEREDFQAARKTALALVHGAQDRYVPGMRTFTDSYDRWARRHIEEAGQHANLDQLALDRGTRSRDSIPSFEDGVKIAAADYADECARQGREPTPGMVEAWLGSGRSERRLDPRNSRSTGYQRHR